MLKSVRKEPTVKKVINLSDDMISEIDHLAIGIYSTRSEFLTEAIRSFTRQRINHDRALIDRLSKEYSGERLSEEALESSQRSLKKLREKYGRYGGEERTPISAYITAYQLDCIFSCFVFPDGEVRNLQEYARIAAASELETMRAEREYVDSLIHRISGEEILDSVRPRPWGDLRSDRFLCGIDRPGRPVAVITFIRIRIGTGERVS